MLLSLSVATSSIPPKNPTEVQMSANVVAGLTTQGHELTGTAQVLCNSPDVFRWQYLSSNTLYLTHPSGYSYRQVLCSQTSASP